MRIAIVSMDTRGGIQPYVAEQGGLAGSRHAARELAQRIANWTRETLAGCEGMELVTGGVGGMVLGLSVAEKLSLPFVETHLQPIGAPTDPACCSRARPPGSGAGAGA